MSDTLAPCPHCGESVPAADAFCEACGGALVELAAPVAAPVAAACTKCGAAADQIDADGYCGACGTRRTARPRDHVVAVTAGAVGVSDRGIRHHRNEDAFALARHQERGGPLAVVVCDGVSSAARSDEASQAAADAACRRLATLAADADRDALVAAFRAAVADAQRAVLAVPFAPTDGPSAPSCTFVAAVVTGTDITIGWLGDSRAYWVPLGGAAVPLTTDHSWAAEQIAAGRDAAVVMHEPGAHAITRWLGADVHGDPRPDLGVHHVDAAGRLLLCSDGLWNVVADDDIGRIVAATTDDSDAALTATAEALVAAANAAGGPDNITVTLTTLLGAVPQPGGTP